MFKKLGQHFLVNRAAIRAIVRAVDPQPGETIIEIGPGHGELTLPLARKCAAAGSRLAAIERDAALAEQMAKRKEQIEIMEGDVLRLLPQITSFWKLEIGNWKLEIGNWKLVGNIPYYLTGRLLRVIAELPRKPSRIVFTLQREVAERLCAQPPAMNLLAAAAQIWAEPRILRHLAPADFRPQPKVESAVVQLESRIMSHESRNLKQYYALIKIIFKQPRQTIANNLARGLKLPKENIRTKLAPLGVSGNERPQELSIATLCDIRDRFASSASASARFQSTE